MMKLIMSPFVYIITLIIQFYINLVNNYGLAIILTTITIKILLLPLSIKQEKGMRASSRIQPKVKEINEKYKNDPQTRNQKIMELYKEHDANPLNGCLPLLIQFPILIAMYTVVRTHGIAENANFLWFYLDRPDALFTIGKFTFNLLPILSGLSQFVQSKMMSSSNTANLDEQAQAMNKSMQFMPIIFIFIFYKLPSAVSLYFIVSSLFQIIQSYVFLQMRKKEEKNNG